MLTIITSTGGIPVQDGLIYTALGIGLAITIAFYVLRSLGLFMLARKQNFKFAFLSFVPAVWMFVACKLISNTRIFKTTFGKLAIVFTLIFVVSEILTLVYNFFTYLPLATHLISGQKLYLVEEGIATTLEPFWLPSTGLYAEKFNYPYTDAYQIMNFINVLVYFVEIFDIASIVITAFVFINLFRAYRPSNYLVYAILSILLGLFPIFIFISRKNELVNYEDYLRARYNYNPYNPYNNPNNPYNNPYSNFNNQEGGASNQKGDSSPFSEFDDKKDSPFTEFDDKNDK